MLLNLFVGVFWCVRVRAYKVTRQECVCACMYVCVCVCVCVYVPLCMQYMITYTGIQVRVYEYTKHERRPHEQRLEART